MNSMCFFYSIINRLLQYYRKNKWIFVLFVIGTVINAVIVCYLYGNLIPSIYNRHSTDVQLYRSYQFSVGEEEPGSKQKKIDELISTGLFETIILRSNVEELREEMLNAVYYGDYMPVILSGEHRMPQNNEIIVPKVGSSYSVGDTVVISGIDFHVIAEHADSDYYIAYDTYRNVVDNTEGEANLITRRLTAVSRQRYIENDDAAVVAFLNLFPGAFYARPHGDFYDRTASQLGTVQILISFTISAVSFVFLFRFMLDSGAKENLISRAVGATKITISVMVFWEGVILVSVATIIGLLLHKILTPAVFSKLNIYTGIEYLFSDYVRIFLLIFVLSMLIIFIFTRKYSKASLSGIRGLRD